MKCRVINAPFGEIRLQIMVRNIGLLPISNIFTASTYKMFKLLHTVSMSLFLYVQIVCVSVLYISVLHSARTSVFFKSIHMSVVVEHSIQQLFCIGDLSFD